MLFLGGLSLAFSILMCIHAVRSGQQMYWLFIILAFQPIGGIIYLFVILGPDATGGSTARRVKAAALNTLDPGRDYREAKAAYDDSPTVGNMARLAEAAAAKGDYAEAEGLYADATQGMHAEDAGLLMGRAEALVELNRNEEALAMLKAVGDLGEKHRTPRAALLMARAYHQLGRMREAEDAYAWSADRLVGLESTARYAAFLGEQGRDVEARERLADIDKRCAKTKAHFRKEARYWRDFAAAAIDGRAT